MISDTMPICSFTDVNMKHVVAYISRHNTGEYTPHDIQQICGMYWKHGISAGVNPILAIAQMVHETGYLSSWWAARPRRNPAGIGVNGRFQYAHPGKETNWHFDGKVWRYGIAFVSWDVAIQAHYGHLLVYALKPQQMNAVQRLYVQADPRAPLVPSGWRGNCSTLKDLNGRWAVPGTRYAAKIAEIATILSQQ